jgi:excisionase family DNA binding protein
VRHFGCHRPRPILRRRGPIRILGKIFGAILAATDARSLASTPSRWRIQFNRRALPAAHVRARRANQAAASADVPCPSLHPLVHLRESSIVKKLKWSGREDSNLRHPAPKIGERPQAGHDRLLSVAEVARKLGVCDATVYKLCALGRLDHVRVLNAIRVSPTMLDEIHGGKPPEAKQPLGLTAPQLEIIIPSSDQLGHVVASRSSRSSQMSSPYCPKLHGLGWCRSN